MFIFSPIVFKIDFAEVDFNLIALNIVFFCPLPPPSESDCLRDKEALKYPRICMSPNL